MSPQRNQSHRPQAGFSLLELMVASTLVSLFTILIGSASGMYFGLVADLDERTDTVLHSNAIRGRMIADAKNAETMVCSDLQAVLFTVGQGAGQTLIEYTTSAGKLLRWTSPPDRQVEFSEGVTSLSCTDLGPRGLEVELAMGDADQPFHFYMHAAEKPGGGGGP